MAMDGKLDKFYEKVAKDYDKNKGNSRMFPFLIRGMTTVPFEELSVLDIGAGTGAIAEMLIDAGVKTVTLVEPSKPMLDVAEEKLKNHIVNKRAATKLDGLPNMDFEDCTYDVIMMNSVVHLIDKHPLVGEPCQRAPVEYAPKIYPGILKSFKESYRVLKPGGMLMITTGLPHQMRYSRWYAEFFPWRVANCYPREPCKEEFEVLLKLAGFNNMYCLVDTSCPLIDDSVLNDPYGIETESWRAGDSDFLSLTEDELKNMKEAVRIAREKGELEAVMKKAMENRDRMGQMTFLIVRKL